MSASTSSLQGLLEGKIDFHGQRKVDNIIRVALILSTILSFVLGFALQSMRVTMGTFAMCTVALALVIVPPWPMYNTHPVQWQSAQPATSKGK